MANGTNGIDELNAMADAELTFGEKFSQRWTPEQRGRLQNRALVGFLNMITEEPDPNVKGGPGLGLELLTGGPAKAGALLTSRKGIAEIIRQLKHRTAITPQMRKMTAETFLKQDPKGAAKAGFSESDVSGKRAHATRTHYLFDRSLEKIMKEWQELGAVQPGTGMQTKRNFRALLDLLDK